MRLSVCPFETKAIQVNETHETILARCFIQLTPGLSSDWHQTSVFIHWILLTVNGESEGVLNGTSPDVGIFRSTSDLLLLIRNLGAEFNPGHGHGIPIGIVRKLEMNQSRRNAWNTSHWLHNYTPLECHELVYFRRIFQISIGVWIHRLLDRLNHITWGNRSAVEVVWN